MTITFDPHFDIKDPEIIRSPYPAYRRLREESPAYWHPGLRSWLLSSYADCATVLRDVETFSADFRKIDEPTAPELLSIQTVDPPEHTAFRDFLGHGFRSISLAELEAQVEARVQTLLDASAHHPSFDLITQVADPLALFTICSFLGVPLPLTDETFNRMNDYVDASMDAGFEPGSEQPGIEARRHFNAVVAGWVASPPSTGMVRWVVDNLAQAHLPTSMVVNSVRAFFHAGFEVPSRFIGNALLALLTDPAAWSQLVEKSGLMESSLEELARFAGPVQAVSRACIRPTVLSGKEIREGEIVVALIAAANRDPIRFANPDQLVLARDPNPHLAFGRGPHSCLGFRVGLIELRAILRVLTTSYPGARVAGIPAWRRNATLRGLRELQVSLVNG